MDMPTRQGIDPNAVFLFFVTICGFLIPMLLIFPPVPPRESDFLLESHSKLGLEASDTKLKSQFSPEHGPKEEKPAKIQSLWIYPLKSCRGIEVTRSNVLPTGLEFDRLFTFAQLKSPFPVNLESSDEEKSQHSWHFITLRQFPLLAKVDVEIWRPDVAKSQKKAFKADGTFVVVRFPWQEDGVRGILSWVAAKLSRGLSAQPEKEIVLPAEFPSQNLIEERGYTHEQVTIWRDTVTALNMEVDLPPELQLYLGVSNKLALFRIDPDKLREVHRCAPSKKQAKYQPVTGFQDAYPLHLLNLSSVQDLNSKVPKDDGLRQLDARRFRANIIITGAPAYDEETWKAIRFKSPETTVGDECMFHVSCRTVRCTLPNVDPETGVRHPKEPNQSLRTHREVDEGAPKKGCLGMQLTPLFEKTARPEYMESTLDLGMSLEVLARGSHRYVPI